MKLISMKQFVIQQKEECCKIESKITEHYFNKIVEYAKLLNQPLELGFFTACDLYGNVLEEPKNYTEDFEDQFNSVDIDSYVYSWYCECKRYSEAKARVKFKFCIVQKISDYLYEIWNDDNMLFTYNRSGDYFLTTGSNIEYLVKYNLFLTQSTQKQLGL